MTNPTGLAEDLTYLQNKYDLDSTFIKSLTAAPESAHLQIQLYKTNMYIVCILSILLGITLVGFAIVERQKLVGLFAGGIGTIATVYFTGLFIQKRKVISDLEKIASYHELI